MFQLFQKPKDVKDVKGLLTEDMTLDQVRVAMLKLLAEENTNHYQMGVLYNYVVDRKLAELADYTDARAYFRKHLADVSSSSLIMYGSVARDFTEEVSRRFGVTCLSLLRTYKELSGIKVNHDDPGPSLIEVPGKKGVETKPFSACSVDEMRKALQLKRKPSSGKPLPAEDVALADKVGKTVLSRFEKGDPVKVQLRNEQGEPVLDFKGIPLSKRAKLAEALLADVNAEATQRPAQKTPPKE